MSDKVELDLAEVKQLFLFLEDLNCFFHSPTKYRNMDKVQSYIEEMYPKLNAMYYDMVWNWLPPKVQQELIDRPGPFDE